MPEATVHGTLQERVSIAGPRRLDGELAYPAGSARHPRGCALLVNPHPYMGGSMHNNVIASLQRALAEAGLACLRFDYSGVGASEGSPIDVAASMAEFWHSNHAPVDPLMIEDAAAALAWLRAHARPAPPPALAVIGYSFGAYVAAAVAPDDAAALGLISPTIVHHRLDPGFARGVPALVIACDGDFATPPGAHRRWLKRVRHDVAEHHCLAGGQHFFLGMEAELANLVSGFVTRRLALREEAATC